MASHSAAPAPTPAAPPASTTTGTPFKLPDAADLSTCSGPVTQAPRYAFSPRLHPSSLTEYSTCYNLTDLINIKVRDTGSEEEKTYLIPRELLKWHSSYFAAALDIDSDFKKSTDGSLYLSESLKVFDAFVCWLYTGRVKDPPVFAADVTPTVDDCYTSWKVLIDIWIFSDMRGVPGLGNAAIDALHERLAVSWQTCSYLETDRAFSNTLRGSTLRKFLVDADTMTTDFTSQMKELADGSCINAEYLIEALPILVKRGEHSTPISRASWTKLDRCRWHDHSGPGGKLRLESRKVKEA